VFLSSTPIEPAIVDYHLRLLADVPDAARRLSLLSASDATAVSLTQKILDRPRLLERVRAAIGDPALAHLSVFNATPAGAHARGAARIPLYGCDPALIDWGSKSGSRRAFREAGVRMPDGAENLRDTRDAVAALAAIKARNPVADGGRW